MVALPHALWNPLSLHGLPAPGQVCPVAGRRSAVATPRSRLPGPPAVAAFGSRQNGPGVGLPCISKTPRCTCHRPPRDRRPITPMLVPTVEVDRLESAAD